MEDFFQTEVDAIEDASDAPGMRHAADMAAHRRRKNRPRRKATTRSGRVAPLACDVNCGTNEDLACSLSNLTLGNAASCCVTSLRALHRDLRDRAALHPSEPNEWSKVRAICRKNDRIFYLMVVVAIVVLACFLAAVRPRA